MAKKYRSSRYSHKFKIQINPRLRTRSVMATGWQKHIKRNQHWREWILPERMEPGQCSPSSETSCDSKKRLRKNEGLRAVPEERSKQRQIRRRKNFQREKEQEGRMKKWRKDRGKRKVLSKMWNGGKIRAIITPRVTHASDGADEMNRQLQARHCYAPIKTKHVKETVRYAWQLMRMGEYDRSLVLRREHVGWK